MTGSSVPFGSTERIEPNALLKDPYTNPDELFDVLDGAGRPTGRTKRRADVHRDGDWHRALHCWVLDESEPEQGQGQEWDGGGGTKGPHLLFQRRGASKDTWPSALDVTVGGHYSQGETLAEVLREVEEEIGVSVTRDRLIWLGTRIGVGEREDGVKDREIQDVFLWRSTLPLAAYRPQPVEVTALERVALNELLALFAGRVDCVSSQVLLPGGELRQGAVRAADIIPTLDRYFYRVAAAADLIVRGYPHVLI